MGATWDITGTRICDGNRIDLSGADDASITTVPFGDIIVAVHFDTSKGPLEKATELRWRDVTDSGTFATLTATGELKYTSNTVLSNDSTLEVANFRCSDQGSYTAQTGWESEDGSAPALNLGDEYESELQFAVDTSGADPNHQYEFELYDTTLGATLGTLGATITMANSLSTASITGDLAVAESVESYREFNMDITAEFGGSTGSPDSGGSIWNVTPSDGFEFSEDASWWHQFFGDITATIGVSTDQWREKIVYDYTSVAASGGFNDSDKEVYITITGTNNESCYTTNTNATIKSVRTVDSNSSGKWYVEFTNYDTGATQMYVGFGNSSMSLEVYPGYDANGWGAVVAYSAGQIHLYKAHSGNTELDSWSRALSDSDVIQLAIDLDAGKLWIGFNGTWYGDPAAGTDPAFTGISGTLFLVGTGRHYTVSSINYWAQTTLRSAPADYDYDAPTGFAPGWTGTATTTFDCDLPAQALVIATTFVTDPISIECILPTQALGITDQIYEGDYTEFLASISGALGSALTFSEDGSSYQIGTLKSTGLDAAAAAEWDWESTLDRYLDQRHVGVFFGFYPSANVYNEFYYQHIAQASRAYILTVSGGSGPIEIPIISFQAMLRDGSPSSLAVTIAGDYADEIRARSGGSLTLETAWMYAGVELIRSQLVQVDIENITISETAIYTRINIRGTGTKTYPGSKVVNLTGIEYEAQYNGNLRYRSGYIAELEPGDTVVSDLREFTADVVSVSVNISAQGKVSETFEIGEGAF